MTLPPDICYWTAHEAQAALERKEISSVELTRAHLDRVAALNPKLHAFLTVTPEVALAAAAASDARRAQGVPLGPLDGIPISVKDMLITEGIRTTAGSRILDGFVPFWNGTVVQRVLDAGAVLLGKNNQDEFAMGSSTENSAFGPTHNPWDQSRVPGGSSGGSAAAVAAGLGCLSLGTDTGGSIRQPASLCGIVGVKPSYGRVSRSGVIAFASSLDQIGPLARDVRDAATLLQVIAGADPLDSTSQPAPVPDYNAGLTVDLQGLRVGVPREYWVEGMDPAVEASVRAAIQTLAELGATIIDISLPATEYALAAYYIIAPAEASANLARYDGVKYGWRAGSTDGPDLSHIDVVAATRGQGFGPEVIRRIMLGTYALSSGYYEAYYQKAQQVRTLVARDFDAAFAQVDVIAAPTSPAVAFPIGAKAEDPLAMYLMDIYTIPANLAGICGVSVPCGLVEQLPVGLQLLGPALGEGTVLRAAYAYEQATPWHTQRPQLGPLG
jgi:aspartyl-tRNA(Asn)/glutamyl-tRNA(Gln) amidotransferase subunit A